MKKAIPSLPASSRMQMPSSGGPNVSKMPMGGKNGATKKLMVAAKGRGMKKK